MASIPKHGGVVSEGPPPQMGQHGGAVASHMGLEPFPNRIGLSSWWTCKPGRDLPPARRSLRGPQGPLATWSFGVQIADTKQGSPTGAGAEVPPAWPPSCLLGPGPGNTGVGVPAGLG